MPWVLCAALYKDVSASMASMEMNFIVLHGFLLYLLKKGPEIFKLVLDWGPNSFFSRTESPFHPQCTSCIESGGGHP